MCIIILPNLRKYLCLKDNLLLVVGGLPSAAGNAVEVVSLYPDRKAVPDCMKNLPQFPYKVMGAAGASVAPGMETE